MSPKPPRIDWAARRIRQAAGRTAPDGLLYDPTFLSAADRAALLGYLRTLVPLWEERFSAHHPPPPGLEQRRLLRPVYWLGNWQFACLGYYHPPRGTFDRCVEAEPFPPFMARLVQTIERRTREVVRASDIPRQWHLNTCLVNLYGDRIEDGQRVDAARVGEHKDFEPGPVASVSVGERALFQFVSSRARGERDAIVQQQWLEDSSLQLFGGPQWKERLFHRVQRVDRRGGHTFKFNVEGFETRRVNLTFRYVPDEHVLPLHKLTPEDISDVRGYVETLARSSSFFAKALSRLPASR